MDMKMKMLLNAGSGNYA